MPPKPQGKSTSSPKKGQPNTAAPSTSGTPEVPDAAPKVSDAAPKVSDAAPEVSADAPEATAATPEIPAAPVDAPANLDTPDGPALRSGTAVEASTVANTELPPSPIGKSPSTTFSPSHSHLETPSAASAQVSDLYSPSCQIGRAYPQLTEQLNQLLDHAKMLDKKANKDGKEANKYALAAAATLHIYEELDQLHKNYSASDNKLSVSGFKAKFKAVLAESNPDVALLNQHRGCKKILANILAFVLTLGAAHVALSVYNGRFSLFNPDTNSAKNLKNIAEKMEQIEVNETEEEKSETFDVNASYPFC